MHRYRFSLFGLFVFVTLVAVGCAAICDPSPLWCATTLGLLLTSLLASLILVLYANKKSRPFWVGYAVVGWLTVILHGAESIVESNRLTPALPTTLVLELAADARPLTYSNRRPSAEARERFVDIGNALFSFTFAFLGGAFARHAYLRREWLAKNPDNEK
jgi:hypothetical protein